MSNANLVQTPLVAGVDQTACDVELDPAESLCHTLQRPCEAWSEITGVPPPLSAGWVCFICITTCHAVAFRGKLAGSLNDRNVTSWSPSRYNANVPAPPFSP